MPTHPPPAARGALAALALSLTAVPACQRPSPQPLAPRSQTWAELRTVRRAVAVTPPGEAERAPYPRERLVDGEVLKVADGGLAWLRRDGGAALLVRGPASLTLRADALEVADGRVFVDAPAGITTELRTPSGPLYLAAARASIDVSGAHASTEAYVLSGELRGTGTARATAGERLVLSGKSATTSPALAWDDWTGGLATTDRVAEPSPYGVGTVGARRPGDEGAPRRPLAIQRLDVRVTVDQDFARTEVDEVFFNPTSEVVEGVYRFRTPDGAVLQRFGVDRDGVVVWGRVKEKQAAAAQYRANVYQGSTEDPALLEWDAPGVYRARLYPIGPGETRRVVVRYGEWLARSGAKGERRLYVYPMAAEGAEASLPHIEELHAAIDLARAGAKEVRAGMAGVRDGDTLIVRAHDLVPRADLAVELFDEGLASPRGYTALHVPDLEALAPADREAATKRARNEAGYVLVPLRAGELPAEGGIDLAIVVDTSAATDAASLAIARAATSALLAHLGKDDRAGVWAGDSGLRPVVAGQTGLRSAGETERRAILAGLSAIERGGATDLGAMLAEAAATLDPARRGAVVYIGDGSPTVGEIALADLQSRLGKLPRPVRIFGLGIGDGADMGILKGLARGAFAERIGDASAAARAALRVLEVAERPVRLGASVDLGPAVESVFPRDLGALVSGESLLVVGRLVGTARPDSVTVDGPGGPTKVPLSLVAFDDRGDLRRRWAEGRLAQMVDENAGRAAMVDLGSRHGIITPVTSLYVPTRNEMTPEEQTELDGRRAEEHRASTRTRGEASKREKDRGNAEVEVDDWETVNSETVEEAPSPSPAPQEKGGKDDSGGTRAKPGERTVEGERAKVGDALDALGKSLGTGRAGGAALPPAQAFAAPTSGDLQLPRGRLEDLPKAPAGGAGDPLSGGLGVGAGDASALPAARQAHIDGHRAGPTTTATTGSTGAAEAKLRVLLAPLAGAAMPTQRADVDTDGVADEKTGKGVSTGEATSQLAQLGFFGAAVSKEDGDHAPAMAARDAWRSEGPTTGVRIGGLPRFAAPCGGAAFVPLDERAQLWRERLARVIGNARAVAGVYRGALARCEAPGFRERARLLSLLLDAMPAVTGRVALWRALFDDLGAADTLYRGMLARVKSPKETRELHDALGLKSIDPGVLDKMLVEANTPVARVAKLRGLAAVWPDDFALALRLLDALEDAGDDAGARELGRKLRARPDADARVRTAVGELYLRLAARAGSGEARARDEGEARRAFGEIVEFAPEDPVARRRLGDLLRAHGWHADAARQYETLAKLAPDDASVPLLLAAAAEGRGLLEEAVKWTEKGGAASAPSGAGNAWATQDAGGGPALTARAFAATYLAWGRLDALQGGRAEEAKLLAVRLARVTSGDHALAGAAHRTRVTLVWSHPELHPSLWSGPIDESAGPGRQRGAHAVPVVDGDPTLGIAVALLAQQGARVEVRVDPEELEHVARLGAMAALTTVFDEGAEGEKIVRTAVRFSREAGPSQRFVIAGSDVRQVER